MECSIRNGIRLIVYLWHLALGEDVDFFSLSATISGEAMQLIFLSNNFQRRNKISSRGGNMLYFSHFYQ